MAEPSSEVAGAASAAGQAVAAVDIGTNTTLLLLARRRGAEVEVIEEQAEITRLGRGIGQAEQDGGTSRGSLAPEAIARTLEVLRRYASAAKAHGARIAAVGTEALRRAANARDFLDPAGAILGTPIEVISGQREAALTFRAVEASFPDLVAAHAAVIDIGGGSTEIVVVQEGRVTFEISLPVGSVRLTERHVKQDPPSEEEHRAIERDVAEKLASAAVPRFGAGAKGTLIGVAGTVTTLAAMAESLATYDSARVHGYELHLEALDKEIGRLARAGEAERKTFVGLDPRRADVIFAGAIILRVIASHFAVDRIKVSDRGIRWGLFYEQAGLGG
jgi:exopolyphosphatase/guanosine-5'-triphosphate,3'-diphosphate pyrophosphatase